eukprot:jgi/Picre1/32322/NNA_007668.t1
MKSHTESRRFALDSIQHENDHLKALLFDICDALQGSHGNQHKRDQQVSTVQRTLEDRRAEAGCPDALYQETVLAEKRVRRLEDQKYQSNITKGEAELQCRSLRTTIDGLRKERILFDELQHKRKHELFCIAQEMASLVPNILSRIESKDQMKRSLEMIRRQSVKTRKNVTLLGETKYCRWNTFEALRLHIRRKNRTKESKAADFYELDQYLNSVHCSRVFMTDQSIQQSL